MILPILLIAVPAPQTTWHVDANATPPGLGTAVQPFARIDYCLDQATTLGGDSVLVAPGDYLNESIDFQGKDVVVLSSAGADSTFLSGLGAGTTPHPLVRFESGETSAASLQGFTLRFAPGGSDGEGSAIKCLGGSPIIKDCKFTGNLTTEQGSALFVENSSPMILDCDFDGNAGEGAVYSKNADLTLTGCTFGSTASPIWGGLVLNNGDLHLFDCTFSSNASGSGDTRAGMHLFAVGATVEARDCAFTGTGIGGTPGRSMFMETCFTNLVDCTFDGFYTDGASGSAVLGIDGDLVAEGCYFTNCVVDGGPGGAVALVACRASFNGCFFIGNRVDMGGQPGGAIYKWGFENLFLTSSVFQNNLAADGGALHVAFGPSVIVSCGFVTNEAVRHDVGGNVARGGAVSTLGTGSMVNTWFFANRSAADVAGEMGDEALGGAVFLGGDSQLAGCIFEDNVASGSSLAAGGAVHTTASPTISHGQFKRNIALDPLGLGTTQGGAIAGPGVALNCSLVGNEAIGGLVNDGGSVFGSDLDHSIVVGNNPNQPGGTATAQYSLISGGYPGLENVDGDPKFWSANDLHLLPGSPCIDTGDPNRPTDPDGTILDRGAFVFDALHCGPGCEGVISVSNCVSNPNSAGIVGQTTVLGSNSVANNLVILTSSALPLGLPGYYVVSPQSGFVPNFGGSQGNLCIGAPLYRLNGVVLRSNAAGEVSRTVDLNLMPPGAVVLPGSTWHFQLWHRDFLGVTSTSNTTSSAEVSFQ